MTNDLARLSRRERDPARPGPGPIPGGLVDALQPQLDRRVRGRIAGDHRAFGTGAGIELDRIRPYEPGDDVRRIDWNVTARTLVPHVREHVPERQLTTWLVLDTSASMAFGTADRRKADVAEGVALVVGRVAARRANRLGLITFGSGREQVRRPVGGRRATQQLLAALAGDPPAEQQGAPSSRRAIELAAEPRARASLVVLVSDFRGERDWQPALAALSAHCEVVAVEVVDPREDALVDVGELTLIDPESGRSVRIDTSDRRLRRDFETAAGAERAELAATFRRLGVRHVRLSTAGAWFPELAAALGRRQRGGRPS